MAQSKLFADGSNDVTQWDFLEDGIDDLQDGVDNDFILGLKEMHQPGNGIMIDLIPVDWDSINNEVLKEEVQGLNGEVSMEVGNDDSVRDKVGDEVGIKGNVKLSSGNVSGSSPDGDGLVGEWRLNEGQVDDEVSSVPSMDSDCFNVNNSAGLQGQDVEVNVVDEGVESVGDGFEKLNGSQDESVVELDFGVVDGHGRIEVGDEVSLGPDHTELLHELGPEFLVESCLDGWVDGVGARGANQSEKNEDLHDEVFVNYGK